MTLLRSLWTEYLRQVRTRAVRSRWNRERERRRKEREDLIVAHMPLVEKIARQMLRKFTQQGKGGYALELELADFVSAGYVGLVQAADRYKAGAGKFEHFAYFRVRGAIVDANRRAQYREAQHSSLEGLQESLGFLPPEMAVDRGPLPDAIVEERETADRLDRAIARLPEAERTLLEMHAAGGTDGLAKAYGVSAASMRRRLAAAREQLAAEMRRAA